MGLIPWTIKSVTIKGIILSHCLHSYPLQTQISKFWQNEKSCWRYHHFTHVYQKSQSHDVRFLRYEVRKTQFLVILAIFWENEKNSWRYYQFTKKYHKWQSYHVWFLSLEIWNVTDRIFCHFGPFFALLPPPPPNNTNHDHMLHRHKIQHVTDVSFIFHFGLFFS